MTDDLREAIAAEIAGISHRASDFLLEVDAILALFEARGLALVPGDRVRAAMREAFDAGVKQGEDEATAFEWNTRPAQSADAAFADLFETWNPEASAILAMIAAAKVTP